MDNDGDVDVCERDWRSTTNGASNYIYCCITSTVSLNDSLMIQAQTIWLFSRYVTIMMMMMGAKMANEFNR